MTAFIACWCLAVGLRALPAAGQVLDAAQRIRDLACTNAAVRDAAVTAMAGSGASGAALLVPLLGGPQPAAESAARALILMGDAAVPALVRALEPGTGPAHRRAVARVLGGIPSAAALAVPGLASALRSDDIGLQRIAAASLPVFGSNAVTPLAQIIRAPSVDSTAAAAACDALAEIGPAARPALDALLAAASDDETDPLVRCAALRAAGRVGAGDPSLVESVRRLVGSEQPMVATAALGALGFLGRSALPALLDALDAPGSHLRSAAIAALGESPPDQASIVVPRLVSLLHSRDTGIIQDALRALGRIGRPATNAVPAMVPFLTTADRTLRDVAAEALLFIESRSTNAIAPLVEQLQHAGPEEGWKAADALGRIGAPALPEVLRVLRDGHGAARWRAAAALGRMGPAAHSAAPVLEQIAATDQGFLGSTAREVLRSIRRAP